MAQRTCAIEGCERPARTRGWCNTHYWRWWANGTTDDPVRPTAEERWWANVNKTDTCWLWTGFQDGKGYGAFNVKKRMYRAHRWGYIRFVGPIPDGLDLDHECHNQDADCAGGPTCIHRSCVNPAHLVPRTHQQNMVRGRGVAAENARKTHCKHGHPFSGANLYVSPSGARGCRTCNAATEKRRKRDWANNGKPKESA